MENKYTVTLQSNENGDVVLPLADEVIEGTGWGLGDKIEFCMSDNGSFVMKKLETELVMVETISVFRMRYVVEVPKGKHEWACDSVVSERNPDGTEIQEFSQDHVAENITSFRAIDKEEFLRMFDEDNAYLKDWNLKQKFQCVNPGYHADNVSVIEEIANDE